MPPITVRAPNRDRKKGIAVTVARTGEPILVPDVSQDPRFSQKIDTLTRLRDAASIERMTAELPAAAVRADDVLQD